MKKSINDKSQFLFYFCVIFTALLVSFIILVSIIEYNSIKVKKEELELNEERIVSLEKNIIGKDFNTIISDLLFITETFEDEHLIDYDHIKNEWKIFVEKKKIYDQIRYIDLNGDEIIRVNYHPDGTVVVDDNKLQNKRDRYYYKDTIKLDKGQVYFSKIDLNIENGKLEKPIKPMLRISTPVYYEDGSIQGIIVLNYYAQNIINSFDSLSYSSMGQLYLLNSKGYYLYHNDDSKRWAFMYDDKGHISFKNEFNKEWEFIIKNEKGTKYTINGFITYDDLIVKEKISNTSIDRIVMSEDNYKIVSYIPNNGPKGYIIDISLINIIFRVIVSEWIYIIFIIIIAGILSILVVFNKKSIRKIKYFSEYDTMTNVLNRRAGIAKLEYTLTENDGKVSVCFVDINGLKSVNDTFGHEAGDELILTIVDGIKRVIRDDDFIIRLGGDEFLIIFKNTNEDDAEKIWERILIEYNKINDNENRKYLVSASHGIAEYDNSGKSFLDEFINLADERMYNEKRDIKKNIKIIRK